VLIDYRKADGSDQLPAIGVDLVRKKVAAICGLPNAIIAAKAVTDTVPMVFVGGVDPVARGLVASFNRPGGNVTGLRLIAGELPSKRIELLHELVPGAIKSRIAAQPPYLLTQNPKPPLRRMLLIP
jgi:putative ABC transport system substrate-binding protein